jgi:hypothetical protein
MKLGVKRKPGEKKRQTRKKFRPLSPFSDPRVPTGHKNLTAFLLSCDTSTTIQEAIREYQREWCEHPKEEQILVASIVNMDDPEYQVGCNECGRLKTYKGRPSTELRKRGMWK